MWLAVLPISFTLAQTDRTIVKNDEVQGSMNSMSAGEILPTDTTPTLSKRELRRERVAKRNLHYNILGGPSYTPDFGLLVGGSANDIPDESQRYYPAAFDRPYGDCPDV